jgi:hypothetical protein
MWSAKATTRWNATGFLGEAVGARTHDYQIMSKAIIRSHVPNECQQPHSLQHVFVLCFST